MNASDLQAQHRLLQSDPQRYVELLTEAIRADDTDASSYFSRHFGWRHLNRSDLALADLARAAALRPHPAVCLSRGTILSELGRQKEALVAFAAGEALDPAAWQGTSGPLQQANCHALLGDERAALAACDGLPEDCWSPGLSGTPSGNRAEIIAALRRRARAARATSG